MKVKVLIISLLLSIVGVTFLIYEIGFKPPSPASTKRSTNIREDVVIFENTFFDFLSERFDQLQDESTIEINEKQLDALAQEAVEMVNQFSTELTPSADEEVQLNRLKFYTYLNVAGDESSARKILDKIPPSEIKFLLLNSYLDTFAPLLQGQDEEKFISYLKAQTWADTYDSEFSKNIPDLLFFSDPLGRIFPDYLGDYFDKKGAKHQLADYKGKYVLIDFWATWCTPCLAELPYLIDAYNQYGPTGKTAPNKFEIISFSFDQDLSILNKFLKEREINWVQYYDGLSYSGPLARKYKVSLLPTTYLLNPEGKVIDTSLRGPRLLRLLKSGILN